MSVPQMKEGPASMLRAMFAGFGSLMSVVDKLRAKPAAEAPADAEAPAAATTPAPEDTAAPEPEATAAPATVVAEATVEPEPETAVAPEATAESETSAAPEAAADAENSAAPETSSALPLANYDDLSIASLRARLRNLSNDDLTQLMSYERAHQDRPEVIKMFQNRLIKMTSGFQKLEA
jgi:hypothetical protein